jgi:hypothetical protein
MPKVAQSRKSPSDLQAFVLNNLRAQNKLKAELAWLETRPLDMSHAAAAQRITHIKANLAAVESLMDMRNDQERRLA